MAIRLCITEAAMIVLCLGAPAAHAEQALDCRQPLDQSTINQCAEQAYDRADQELNLKYKHILDTLRSDPQAAKLLKKAERAWIGFRDAECALETSAVAGGTMSGMVTANCLEKLTRRRLVDFEPYLDCRRGGVDCPTTTVVRPILGSNPMAEPAAKAP
jgi:uncharacterized protein YecT (DUF1311 family)